MKILQARLLAYCQAQLNSRGTQTHVVTSTQEIADVF